MDSIYTSFQEKGITAEDVAQFRKEQLAINSEIQKALTQGNRSPIGDGAFNEEGYLKARVKILWLMKEPYDTVGNENVEEAKTGGWYFSDSSIYKDRKFSRARTTWYPIINVSHAILTSQTTWNQNEKISTGNKTVSDVLSHIAFINIQKLASLTRAKTNWRVINTAFKTNREWIDKQVELLNPDIIIGGGTLNDDVFMHFGLQGKQIIPPSSNEAYMSDAGNLFVRAMHPAQTKEKAHNYVNDILAAVQAWKQKLKNETT